MKKNIDLTVIVTMHDEGVLAHKTLRSVFEALEQVESRDYTYEIIIHVDNGDEDTQKYLRRYFKDDSVTIYDNNFGDPGLSRNFAIKKAAGEYVTVLDGDDLVSDNWFYEALKVLKDSHGEIVVHPEAVLTFGIDQENVLTLQTESLGRNKDTVILLGENRWCSVAMAQKETFLKVPYRKLDGGYSHEDYVFNLEITDLDIKHCIAKNTVLFYRRSGDSRLSMSNNESATIPYVGLFEFEKVRSISEKVALSRAKVLESKGYKLYKKIRDNDFLNSFITPVAKATIKVLNSKPAKGGRKKIIPNFVIDEWIKINHIESQLYPHDRVLKKLKFYSPENQSAVGENFCHLAQCVTKKPDYIFVVPWIIRGGAEKVMLNYIEAMRDLRPDWHILVISTLPAKNTWVNKLPRGVDFVDFGNCAASMPKNVAEKLFTRIMVQIQCKNIHIINSEFGYNWARQYKKLLKEQKYNLVASLFTWEYIAGSNMKAVDSYDNPGLFEIYDVVRQVYTDNKTVIQYAMDKNGFVQDKFTVHYQPLGEVKRKPVKEKLVTKGNLNILWAERVVPTKLPELVAKIGKKLNKNIKLHVYGEVGEGVDPKVFDGIANIEYHGKFDGFMSLPHDKMDLLLYTALSDGMPNVVLEAAAVGLPIIATNDGGVGEFIKNHETGILVENWTAEKFIEEIDWAEQNMPQMWQYAKNAQKLLDERHTKKRFMEQVEKDFKL